MEKIRSITVRIEPLPEDTGGTNVFRDPQGQFHKIEGIDFFLDPVPPGCRNVLATWTQAEGRERELYVEVTRDQIKDMFLES